MSAIQRAQRKITEAKKLLTAAADQAPALELAPVIEAVKAAESRSAQILREGIIDRKDAA